MSLQQWALPQLSQLLPLDQGELEQLISHIATLPDAEASRELTDLLGESPQSLEFIQAFIDRRAQNAKPSNPPHMNGSMPPDVKGSDFPTDSKGDTNAGSLAGFAPPPGPPPGYSGSSDSKSDVNGNVNHQPAGFAPPSGAPPTRSTSGRPAGRHHTNEVIEAGKVRARDEQEMQQLLQSLQFQYRIYNSDIEPEHETEYPCSCPIHQYQARKYRRYGVQDMWSKAVMYPGEKAYNDNKYGTQLFNNNPYQFRITSPYGTGFGMRQQWGPQRPIPAYHARSIHQTIDLNNALNHEAQTKIDAKEPKHSIWEDEDPSAALAKMNLGDKKIRPEKADGAYPPEKPTNEKRQSTVSIPPAEKKSSKLSSFRKSIGIKSSDERAFSKAEKAIDSGKGLRDAILAEEEGRWPDEEWRYLVAMYQDKVGMTKKIADLRARHPIQYLHLLKAGYFEPIPVAWANQASNPLKFSIEAAAGWRGITPNWRGYEDMAEERLYWVLNHREGSVGMRMKPDFISEMNMARDRMSKAVDPPPGYYSANDTCHLQHTSPGYSKQVMPPPFRAFDRPENPTDDTMILLDVSGSMDFDPAYPIYDQYMVTRYARSTQPKNKDVAKAIIRRFTDAMANHDHQFRGYDMTTFSDRAKYIGTINHSNLDQMWQNVRLGGGTRVMTGWQQIKELHFQKHSESATHHPVYGWQAGPQTPMLRLLLLLDGEATDMDEFELDLLGLSWAHVTIFLIGVDGCPHHHRHANELQRISDVNHHVSFVDAQGNTPERYVTHELLKRHLGYDITMQEFEQMEELPAYSE